MSLLTGLLDNLAPYIDATAQGAAAVQRGTALGEQERQRQQEAEEERAWKRRSRMLALALGNLNLETGRERLNDLRAPDPEPVLKGTGGREFPNTPEGQAAYLEWERTMNPGRFREPRGPQGFDPSTDPEVLRELYFRDNQLGRYAPDEEGDRDPYAREILSIDTALERVDSDPRTSDWTTEEKIAGARRLMSGQPLVPPSTAAPREERGGGLMGWMRGLISDEESTPRLPAATAQPPASRAAGAPGRDTAAPAAPKRDTAAVVKRVRERHPLKQAGQIARNYSREQLKAMGYSDLQIDALHGAGNAIRRSPM